MATFADREAAKGVSETYQYLVDGSAFHFIVDDGSIELRDGRAENPAVTLTTNEETLAEIVGGKITASSAATNGALTVTGDRQAAKRLGRIFSHDQILAQARAAVTGARER
jgi:putative sterol carrier protein